MSKPPTTIPSRGLNIRQAASYWGVSRGTFLKLVKLGMAPSPMALPGLKRNVYDRVALDAAMTHDSRHQPATPWPVPRRGGNAPWRLHRHIR